jgi:hypothetical protein
MKTFRTNDRMCTQSRGIDADIVERFHRTLLNEFYRVAFQPGRSSQRATVRNLLPNSDVKSATISLAAFIAESLRH